MNEGKGGCVSLGCNVDARLVRSKGLEAPLKSVECSASNVEASLQVAVALGNACPGDFLGAGDIMELMMSAERSHAVTNLVALRALPESQIEYDINIQLQAA